jgi:glyoxylase-like metal-dependent hydrolase (beta-lactamase superfamily II)
MKRISTVLTAILLCSSTVLNAQKKEITIETTKLTDQVYMLKGSGGNIGLFIGDNGVFMIDDQFAPLTPKILDAIKKITNKPVRYLINTHWHGDHTGGNENMQKEGAIIVAHKNVRKRMNMEAVVRGKTKPASPKEALPVLTFTEDMMVHFNDDDVLISHVHEAHTDGDAIIYFTKNNVIHMGDAYFQGKFPYIDLNSGGSIHGYIAAAEKVILLSDDETKIIPGHRNVSNRKELMEFKHMLVTLKNRVQKAIDNGKTLIEVEDDETVTQEYKETYGGWFISAEKMRSTIYKSLKKKM